MVRVHLLDELLLELLHLRRVLGVGDAGARVLVLELAQLLLRRAQLRVERVALGVGGVGVAALVDQLLLLDLQGREVAGEKNCAELRPNCARMALACSSFACCASRAAIRFCVLAIWFSTVLIW